MLLKLHYWIFILGLFASGLSYALPVKASYTYQGTSTEQIVEQKQELPAANFCVVATTPALFAALDFDCFYFPSLLDLQDNRIHLKLKLQFNIFSQQENLLQQHLLFSRVNQNNPLFH